MIQVEKIRVASLSEYGKFTSFDTVANTLGIDVLTFKKLFNKAIRTLAVSVSKSNFIEYKNGDYFRFTGIAGILILSPRCRLEIIPKFLNESNTDWREDFLRISLITGYGKLSRDSFTSSSHSNKNDLFDIITQTWIGLFESHSRFLIRKYIKTTWFDFNLDGEIDEEDLLVPTQDGFMQTGIRLSRSNSYNAILFNAAKILRQQALMPIDSARLDRAIKLLENAMMDKNRSKKRSSSNLRDSKWADILHLSNIILLGGSIGYSGAGASLLPGFILKTHEAWEKLIFMAVQKSFSSLKISKKGYTLGMRTDKDGNKKPLSSTPDIIITLEDGSLLLADAKYKIVADDDAKSKSAIISSSDIYESLAFLRASKSEKLLLFYPNRQSVLFPSTTLQPVEIFSCDSENIIAFTIGVIGISSPLGFEKLKENLNLIIKSLI